MTLTIRKLLFLLVVFGAFGLLVQACVHDLKKTPIVWDSTSSKPILRSTKKTDTEKEAIFRAQLIAQSDGYYRTSFTGGFSSMRKCLKINPSTITKKVPCDDPPEPNAIHVAQHVQFADQGRKDAFLKNLELN
jgi:hypothetical protein